MSDSDTTLLLEQDEQVICTPATPSGEWKAADVAADIATLGTGTLVAALINAAVVFIVPKLLTVEAYGYWRLFSLYAAYAGFLHFGFADGALLRWAGQAWEQFSGELRPAAKYLFLQHLIVVALVIGIATVELSGPRRFIAILVVIYALIINETTLLQFALQSARMFRPVAASTVAAPMIFLASVLLWHARGTSGYREVTILYVAGWLAALGFLLWRVKPRTTRVAGVSALRLAKLCVSSGWPIVMANTGVAVIAFADRLAVSWAASIQDFAQYSLAGSAMAVLTTAIQACSKVFFSHLASIARESRQKLYGSASRTLLIAWAALLPFYFALQLFVRHALPKYNPSLQYARILLLGIPFLATIQILQMSYAYLHGMQRRFLMHTALALAACLGATSFAAFYTGALRVVAVVQVVVLAGAWLLNEVTLRLLTHQGARDWSKFGAIYLLSTACYWIATTPEMPAWSAVLGYYIAVTVMLFPFCTSEWSMWSKLLHGEEE